MYTYCIMYIGVYLIHKIALQTRENTMEYVVVVAYDIPDENNNIVTLLWTDKQTLYTRIYTHPYIRNSLAIALTYAHIRHAYLTCILNIDQECQVSSRLSTLSTQNCANSKQHHSIQFM